jgi:glycolate oxidase
VRGDDAWVDDFVKRAKDNGFTSFCMTVDVASYSRRERDLIGRYVKPWRAKAQEGANFQSGLSWEQVKRFKDKHDLPLILKGIATVEDAKLAVKHGVEVVYVSNHGGRQLDHGLGSVAVLPGILKAVGKKAEVWVDGGFMRGSDVVKAIALGAKAVGIGRLAGLGPRRGRRAGPGARARNPRGRDPHLPRPARRHFAGGARPQLRDRGARGQPARHLQRLSAHVVVT